MRSMAMALALVLPFAAPARAASVTVSDQSAKLPGVAQATTTILVNAGLPLRRTAKTRFVVELNGFHCDRRSNGAVDFSDPTAGLESLQCRMNAADAQATTTGQPFGDAHALAEILDKIQENDESAGFSDCGMGYCGVFVKTIACTIRTDIENFENGGRWQCTFTGGQ